ncbi:mechanosensitive ion channel family protein [Corallincola holothuriorum]|uniref:Small-conductance mechanosensitive channel n=1 Tax=Corallincola holothuriorum TaxID=2282215 RepID=A0A368N6M4_9GAMM|nr:mechanosensitive ion channel domain-containing protein [Corallincola holothuriorum]RCU45663.1 mechanosensitive ion channel family protein [Corallincola holothuriorum]
MEQIEVLITDSQPMLQALITNVVLALVIFFVGRLISRSVRNIVEKMMNAKSVEATLVGFIGNLVYYAAMTLTVIVTLSQLGIETTSFAAVIAAAGLAIGLALQGSLSNFAAGVLIVIFRPFNKGDYVEAGGKSGSVESIQIFSTVLKTPDNKVIVVPNAQVTGGAITNFSRESKRRVDLVIGVSYDSDLAKAKSVAEQVMKQHALVLDDDFTIGVAALADSSVNLAVRCWVNTPDYWTVFFDLNEQIKQAYDEAGVTIPFPQMDVHLSKP